MFELLNKALSTEVNSGSLNRKSHKSFEIVIYSAQKMKLRKEEEDLGLFIEKNRSEKSISLGFFLIEDPKINNLIKKILKKSNQVLIFERKFRFKLHLNFILILNSSFTFSNFNL